MSIERMVIFEVGAMLLLYYKLNKYTFYRLKLLIHGKKSSFRKIKPWDCFTCLNIWVAAIVSASMQMQLTEAMYFIGFVIILSMILEKHIES